MGSGRYRRVATGLRAPGPLRRAGSQFIRAAELLSDPSALLSSWEELRFAGHSVSVAGRERGKGWDCCAPPVRLTEMRQDAMGLWGAVLRKNPFLSLAFPCPLLSPSFVSLGPQLGPLASSGPINMAFLTA